MGKTPYSAYNNRVIGQSSIGASIFAERKKDQDGLRPGDLQQFGRFHHMKKVLSVTLAVLMLVTLTASVFATGFTPSAEQKAAPVISGVQNEAGETVAALLLDASGNEVGSVPFSDLIITPVSQKGTAGATVQATLDAAFDELIHATSLFALVTGLGTAAGAAGVAEEDAVISDLFDISLAGASIGTIPAGGSIRIVLRTVLEPFAALHRSGAGEWESIDFEYSNGLVTITLTHLSAVALVVDAAEEDIDPVYPATPDTGESVSPFVYVGAGLLLAGGVLLAVALKKSKHPA
jgi:LPXTG-motif cell wall-anchored protein